MYVGMYWSITKPTNLLWFSVITVESGDEILKAVSVLKPTGCYSHIVHPGTDNELLGQMKEKHAKGEGVSVVSTFVHPNGSQLQELADLMAANKVKLVVHQVCSWCAGGGDMLCLERSQLHQ